MVRGKSIVLVVAPENFRDEEYNIPKKVFQDAGFVVMTASKGVKIAKGKFGAVTTVDMDLSQIQADKFDAIVLVGGPGSVVYQKDLAMRDLLTKFFEKGKLVSAICIAPMILLKGGFLKGKRATVWNEDGMQAPEFKAHGAFFEQGPVCEFGNIITANGPENAELFAKAVVKYLRL